MERSFRYVLSHGNSRMPHVSQTESNVTHLVGAVQAGFLSPAEEELVDIMDLDEYLIRRPEATFMLTVSGDSMIDAGIRRYD